MRPAEACYDAPRCDSIAGKTARQAAVGAAARRHTCEVKVLLRGED
jgi:hypothetical protein